MTWDPEAVSLLACPVCACPLRLGEGFLACPRGHSFDVAREGYVNLLAPQHRTRNIDGDRAEMVQARGRFHDAGHFGPLSDALGEAVAHRLAARVATGPAVVLEVGCGDGYYLGGVSRALVPSYGAVILGTDLSKSAVRTAARSHPGAAFFVADLNQRIYLQDAVVSVLLDVFSPRNPAEFDRVLEPGGTVMVVIPGPDHFASVRAAHALLDIQPEKERLLVERFAERFSVVGRHELRYPLDLGPNDIRDFVAMGPSSWHARFDPDAAGPLSTEASFITLEFAKRADAGK